jgi:hypothetical protein
MHSMRTLIITLLLAAALCSCSEAARPSKNLKVVRSTRRLSHRKEHFLERAVRLRGGAAGVQAVSSLEEVQSILSEAGDQVSVKPRA